MAISASSSTTDESDHQLPWWLDPVRNHLAHALVVAFFVAYPGLYHLLITSPLSEEMITLLPRMSTMVIVLYFGLFAMSFDFISGYSGYLSFGHAAFYGAGAYLVVLIANGKVPLLASGTPFMVSLLLAGLVAGVLAVLIGLVAFRLTGVYFAMITLGVAEVLHVFMRNWDYVGSNPRDGAYVLEHPEGFEIGVPGIDALNLQIGRLTGDAIENFLGLGLEFSTTEVSYYMVGLVVLVAYFTMQRIIHSPFGRVMIAIRENEERAEAVGYDTVRYKIAAFAMSAFFAGVAGALFAGYARSVSPDNTFFFLVTGFALLAAIIGGFGTLAGPLFGYLFYQTLNEFLTKEGGGLLPYLRDNLGEGTLRTELAGGLTLEEFIDVFLNGHAALYIGIVFVLFVLYVPNGLLGTLRVRLGGTIASELPKRVAAVTRRYAERLDRYRP